MVQFSILLNCVKNVGMLSVFCQRLKLFHVGNILLHGEFHPEEVIVSATTQIV